MLTRREKEILPNIYAECARLHREENAIGDGDLVTRMNDLYTQFQQASGNKSPESQQNAAEVMAMLDDLVKQVQAYGEKVLQASTRREEAPQYAWKQQVSFGDGGLIAIDDSALSEEVIQQTYSSILQDESPLRYYQLGYEPSEPPPTTYQQYTEYDRRVPVPPEYGEAERARRVAEAMQQLVQARYEAEHWHENHVHNFAQTLSAKEKRDIQQTSGGGVEFLVEIVPPMGTKGAICCGLCYKPVCHTCGHCHDCTSWIGDRCKVGTS